MRDLVRVGLARLRQRRRRARSHRRRARRRHRDTRRHPGRDHSGRGPRRQPPRDVKLPASAFTDDPMAVVTDPDIDLVVEVMGGRRAGPRAHRDRAASAQAGDHREQGTHRAARCRAVRHRRGCRRRPAVRSLGRGRHSADPAAARVARRGSHPARARHRQRHDQLHPHPDGRRRRDVRRRARGGAAARVRRSRPHRRRRGVRRRGEGRDHRHDRVRRAGPSGRRLPRRHHADHRRRHPLGPRASGTW